MLILLLLIPLKGRGEVYPILFSKGYILTEAIIEGQSVLVILDSGAPGLVLNQKYYEADPSKPVTCIGINGSFEANTTQVGEWHWLGITHKKTKALVSDLSFIERSLNKRIHALIGLSVLHDYYVSIDFETEKIRVLLSLPEDIEGDFSRFQYIDHIPVITCKVNGEKKILGLDSGSAGNYLFGNPSLLNSPLSADASPIVVIGTDNRSDIKHQMEMKLEVLESDFHLAETFIIDAGNKGGFQEAGLDGILGHSFLSNFNITIHPGKQRIWMQKRVDQPSFASSLMP